MILNYKELDSYELSDYNKFTDSFIAVDIETTGLTDRDDIVEIATLKYVRGQMVEKFVKLVKPSVRLSYEASCINGITDAMLKNEKPIKNIIFDLHTFLCDGNLPLVFHNAKFDLKFILRDLNKYNLKLNNHIICTFNFAKNIHNTYFEENLKLQTIAKYFKISKQTAHRAEGDACTTALVYLKLLDARKNEEQGVLLQEISENDFKNDFEYQCSLYANSVLINALINNKVTFVKNKSHVNVYANNIFILSIHVTKNTTRINFQNEDMYFDSFEGFKDLMVDVEKRLHQMVSEDKEQKTLPKKILNDVILNEKNEVEFIRESLPVYIDSKKKYMALILCILGITGLCGLHRFYVRKIGTGILWLLTFGLFGFGQIIDLILIISDNFKDSTKNVVI